MHHTFLALLPFSGRARLRPALLPRVLPTVGKEHLIARRLAHAGDAPQQKPRKRAPQIADAAADQHGTAGLQALGGAVRPIIQLPDHALDPQPGLLGDVLVTVVQETGNRGFRHPAKRCDLIDRYLFSCSTIHGKQSPSLSVHTLSSC